MNRRATLAATSGLLALGLGTLVAPSAGAFPIRDFSPICPDQSALASIDLLSTRYARYLTNEELRTSDANGNGSLCVIRLQLDASSTSIDSPITYVDDSDR